MQMEVAVMLADWLAGTAAPGKGLNDYLPDVSRLSIDAAAPADIALFADPFRSETCASFYSGTGDATPAQKPAVYVTPEGPADAEGEPGVTFRTFRSVSFVVRFILEHAHPHKAARLAEYYRRAGALSVQAWLAEDAEGAAGRRLNDIYVVAANRQLSGPWAEEVGNSIAFGVLALDLEVRDYAPRAE